MNRFSKVLWIWLPGLAGILVALSMRVYFVEQYSSKPQGALKQLEPERITALNNDSISVANYLLIDSIMSIVQSYYVDADRISPDHILDITIAELSDRTHIHSEINGDRSALTLRDGEYSRELVLKSSLDYNSLVEILARIAQFLDKDTALETTQSNALSEVTQGAMDILNYLLESLDAHSSLLDQHIYRELKQGTEGSFGGLGILVGSNESSLTIIKPIEGSPAAQAKLRRHDKIIDIDGVDTYGQSLDSLVEYMRGEPGTNVNLSILRDGYYAPLHVKLKRKVINVNSVESKLHRIDGKGYMLNLKVDSFSARTTQEILGAINKAISKIGTKLLGISLDLRSNPGGLLDQAIEVADLFLDEGVIVSTRGRRTEVENAGRNYARLDLPIFVLIDKESASASEIVAGALQDHDRAIVIGQPSFGKGSVQTVFELPGERALKLTIARYYTPSGRAIQNVGIYPDVWLQPIIQRSRNINLFGKSRYRSERFLSHRLESRSSGRNPVQLTPFRSYYLLDEQTESAFSDYAPLDHELEVAKIILSKVVDNYETPLKEGYNRASHWLVLASGELNKFLEDHKTQALSWLNKRFNINWQVGASKKFEPVMSFRLMKNHLQAFRGSTLQIPWKITNTGNQTSTQVSLFLRSNDYSVATKEVLVGRLKPRETKYGSFKVKIPMDHEDKKISFSVGPAINALPLSKQSWHFTASVANRKRPELVFDYDLVEESIKPNGILDPGEQAKIKIYLKNNGADTTRPVKLVLRSLAGRQIFIDKTPQNIGAIKSGEEATLLVDIKAAQDLVSQAMKLGMTVQSPNLAHPIRQTLSLRSTKNTNEKDIDLLAH